MKQYLHMLILVLFLVSACSQQKIFRIIDSEYNDKKIEREELIIAPISSDIRYGGLFEKFEEYPETKVEEYHLELISNFGMIITKTTSFKSAYYSYSPLPMPLQNKSLSLSAGDAFEIELPEQTPDTKIKYDFGKKNPSFILFLNVEIIDYVSDANVAQSLTGNFYGQTSIRFAQRFKYAIWDIKQHKIVSYGRTAVTGDLAAISNEIFSGSPFSTDEYKPQ